VRGEFRGEAGEMVPEGGNECFEGCTVDGQLESTNPHRHSVPFFSSTASRYRAWSSGVGDEGDALPFPFLSA